MIAVVVPQSNRKVWQPSGRAQLTDEAISWLETHVGNQQFRHPDSDAYHNSKDHFVIWNNYHSFQRATGTKIYFSNPRHAVLFKVVFL